MFIRRIPNTYHLKAYLSSGISTHSSGISSRELKFLSARSLKRLYNLSSSFTLPSITYPFCVASSIVSASVCLKSTSRYLIICCMCMVTFLIPPPPPHPPTGGAAPTGRPAYTSIYGGILIPRREGYFSPSRRVVRGILGFNDHEVGRRSGKTRDGKGVARHERSGGDGARGAKHQRRRRAVVDLARRRFIG